MASNVKDKFYMMQALHERDSYVGVQSKYWLLQLPSLAMEFRNDVCLDESLFRSGRHHVRVHTTTWPDAPSRAQWVDTERKALVDAWIEHEFGPDISLERIEDADDGRYTLIHLTWTSAAPPPYTDEDPAAS